MNMASKAVYLALCCGAGVAMMGCTPEAAGSKTKSSEIYGTYKGTPMTKHQIEEIIKAMTPYTGEQAARDAVESKIVRN